MRTRARGFGMADVLIAGVVLSVVLYAMLNLLPAGMAGLRKGRDMTAATNLAQQVMEELRASRFADLSAGPRPAREVTVDGTAYRQVTVSWEVPQASAASSPRASVSYATSVYDFRNP